jgi:hypothetical protein
MSRSGRRKLALDRTTSEMAPRASSRSRGKSPQVAATPRSARKSRGLADERQNPLPLIHASEVRLVLLFPIARG